MRGDNCCEDFKKAENEFDEPESSRLLVCSEYICWQSRRGVGGHVALRQVRSITAFIIWANSAPDLSITASEMNKLINSSSDTNLPPSANVGRREGKADTDTDFTSLTRGKWFQVQTKGSWKVPDSEEL